MGFIIKIDVDKVCEKAIGGEQGFNAIINDLEQNGGQFCSYNLILMDCNMPFMDGYQSTIKIRQYLYEMNIPQPIIVAVTGHSEIQYVQKAIYSGMNQVLSKPINSSYLKHLIRKLDFVTDVE